MFFPLLHKLQSRPLIAWLLAGVYAAAIIFSHDVFTQLSVAVMKQISLPIYNFWVLNIFVFVGLLVFTAVLYKCFNPFNLKLFFFFGISASLLVLHTLFLIEMNIELIHALEFALLAVLLFAATGRFGAAVAFALPVMLLDEWVQYNFLYYSYTEYFAFNDVVLDILGSGLAMVFIAAYNTPIIKNTTVAFYDRSEFILLTTFVTIFLVLLFSCVIATHNFSACEHTYVALSRINNPGDLWQTHNFTKARYIVLSPAAGAVVIFLLCTFYMGLDGYSSTAKTSPSSTV